MTSLLFPPGVSPDDLALQPYRPLYAEFRRFEAERRTRYPHLQLRVVAWPRDQHQQLEGLVLVVRSPSVEQPVPYRLLEGAELPLLPAADREDGVVVLNRAPGRFSISTQYSVRLKEDGRYPLAYLRAACDEGLSVLRSFRDPGAGRRARRCNGVQLRYQHHVPDARFEQGGLQRAMLPVRPALAFGSPYQLVQLRFADWPAGAQLHTRAAPDVIDFLFE